MPQRVKRVEAVIEKIRPQLRADHGDVELVEIDGKTDLCLDARRLPRLCHGACDAGRHPAKTDRGVRRVRESAAGQPHAGHSKHPPGGPTMPDIYLDNNATTKVDPQVVEAMLPFFTEQFGNPSSMHSFGDRVGKAIKHARQQVQELLGAQHDSEIIFTSCGTEAGRHRHHVGAQGVSRSNRGDHDRRGTSRGAQPVRASRKATGR